MTLYRANDRHPEDDRILIIQDMNDFRLWRERANLSIGGIIHEAPFPAARVQKAAEIIAVASKNIMRFDPLTYFGDRRSGRQANITASSVNRPSMPGMVAYYGINGVAQEIILELSDTFRDATETDHAVEHYVRVNDDSVNDDHRHGRFLNFTFNAEGMHWTTGENKGEGQILRLKAGNAGLFGPEIWHGSPSCHPEWQNSSEDTLNERVSLVII